MNMSQCINKSVLKQSLDQLNAFRLMLEDLPLVEVCVQLVALDDTIEKLEKQLENYEQD